MPEFAAMFIESDGKPIQYQGKTLVQCDQFPLAGAEVRVKFRFISTNSEWNQGMSLETDGEFVFDDGDVVKGNMGIWEHTAPKEDEFLCRSRNGLVSLHNVWDEGRGGAEYWINGAAMWIEEIPNGRRYHCNDGHFDDDFDDLIFELTIVDTKEK